LDLLFLTKFETYGVLLKLLRSELYRKSLHSQQFYSSWQIKLLDHEISAMIFGISILTNSVHLTEFSDRSNFTALDLYHVLRIVSKTLESE